MDGAGCSLRKMGVHPVQFMEDPAAGMEHPGSRLDDPAPSGVAHGRRMEHPAANGGGPPTWKRAIFAKKRVIGRRNDAPGIGSGTGLEGNWRIGAGGNPKSPRTSAATSSSTTACGSSNGANAGKVENVRSDPGANLFARFRFPAGWPGRHARGSSRPPSARRAGAPV